MSSIKVSSDGVETPDAVGRPVAFDSAPQDIAAPRDTMSVTRFFPIQRRPPALQFEKKFVDNDQPFDDLIEQHVARYQSLGNDALVYNLANFTIRTLAETEHREMKGRAAEGFRLLNETIRMFEHLYIAQKST